MPKTSKKQTGARFVDLNINLNVPRKQLSTVKEALNAIFELAGVKPSSGKIEKTKPSAKPGRPPKGQTAKTKKGQIKPAKKAKIAKAVAQKKASKTLPKAAALIRSLRTEAGLSQKALASKMGVYQNTVSLLELGKQKPNLDTAIKLGKALGTEHEKFLE